MLCKACSQRPISIGKKQIKIPHPNGKKNHYEIVHEDEDMCSVCIGWSSGTYSEDEDFSIAELGIDVPQHIPHYEDI